MMNQIIKRLNSINSYSKNIIKIGCIIVFLFCTVGALIIEYNVATSNEVYLYKVGSTMVYISCVLLTQVVIGGLIIDFFNTMLHNND